MAKVAPPIIETQIRNAALRPRMSPTRPKISAPSGRKAKPTPNNASAAICPAIGSSWAKKVLAMIACRLPKMKKSYHSNAVPAAEAATTVRMGVVAGDFAGAIGNAASVIRPPRCAGSSTGAAHRGSWADGRDSLHRRRRLSGEGRGLQGGRPLPAPGVRGLQQLDPHPDAEADHTDRGRSGA